MVFGCNILKYKVPVIRIGTSGYTYSWNKKKPTAFQWYINQGFNSVEINASYYRFPRLCSLNDKIYSLKMSYPSYEYKK
jgi:hypothetical protein